MALAPPKVYDSVMDAGSRASAGCSAYTTLNLPATRLVTSWSPLEDAARRRLIANDPVAADPSSDAISRGLACSLNLRMMPR
jgi:hypothetical protein